MVFIVTRRLGLCVICCVVFGTVGIPSSIQSPLINQTLLVISLDGFRWDYMNTSSTPNLDFIVRTGVKAQYLRSAFPTTTYPNHVTMVTGLYPESHGIVANYMYDPVYHGRFNIKVTASKWWNEFGAEPIWITNQKQGGRSGVVHWPGYNVRFDNMEPILNVKGPSGNIDIGNVTGHVMSFRERVELVSKWLTSERPPNFVALYFEEPDEVGHAFGPNSEETRKVIAELDHIIGILMKNLKDRNILDRVNIIVTTDHGMTDLSSEKRLYLDDYLDPSTYDIWDASTNMMISPHEGKLDEIYNKAKRIPHSEIYRKADIPQSLHFSNNRRIPELFLLVEEGWTLKPRRDHPGKFYRGNHGYDSKYKSMDGFLIARGPAFRRGYEAKGFDNVHLYPLMCKVLGIQPRPNNGSLAVTESMLKPSALKEKTSRL